MASHGPMWVKSIRAPGVRCQWLRGAQLRRPLAGNGIPNHHVGIPAVVDSASTSEEVLGREASWKEQLGSRAYTLKTNQLRLQGAGRVPVLWPKFAGLRRGSAGCSGRCRTGPPSPA